MLDTDEASSTNDYSTSGRSSFNSNSSNNSLIEKINSALESLIEENKNLENYKENMKQQKKSIFFSTEVPEISVLDYLYRIQNFSDAEDNTFILALIYIDKICETASIILSKNNIHRILFMSILTAIKYNEDLYYDNEYYAKIAGISAKELKKMELEYLKLIKFELYVNKSKFDKYKNYINEIKDTNKIKSKCLNQF
jgi:hypothetical protein